MTTIIALLALGTGVGISQGAEGLKAPPEGGVLASARAPRSAESTPQDVSAPDPQALEAFVDQFMAEERERLRVPGAVFAFVQNGALTFSKGYGVENLQSQRPVSPEQTVFRMASISKVFTTTAIMQLVERGLIDLDEDVNRYLTTMKVADAFDEPVRIWHLMSHTAGFEDKVVGIAARSAKEQSLERFLRENQPHRVVPPGDQFIYSNYGTCLLGRVIEEVTGQNFSDYIKDHILDPLGMSDSSFANIEPLHRRLATGYLPEGSSYLEVPRFHINMMPSSTLVSTAHDMAKFMLAHLGEGTSGDRRILGEETARRMHTTLFTQHPSLPGNAHGFWERHENGLRLIEHGGVWFGYECWMVLIPELKAGFFVAHTGGDVRFRTRLGQQLLDRFFPNRGAHTPEVRAKADPTPFAGNYKWNRYVRNTFEKAVSLMDGWIVRLDPHPEGGLVLHYPDDLIPPRRFIRVGRDLFAQEDGDGHIAFRRNAHGAVTHLYAHIFDLPIVAERVDTLGLPKVQLHTGIASASVVLSALILLPLGTLWRRRARARGVPSTSLGWAERIAIGLTITILVFLASMAIVLGPPNFYEAAFGIPQGIRYVLSIPLVALALSMVLIAVVCWEWLVGHRSWLHRTYLTLFTLASLWFLYVLNEINWLGPGGAH